MAEETGAATQAPETKKPKGPRPERKKKVLTETPVLPALDADVEKDTRLYELCVLFDPGEATRTWDKLEGWVKELITERHGAHVLRIDKWADNRKLAYEIKGLKRGTYMVVWLRAKPAVLSDLDRDLRLDEKAVRHILIYHEQEPPTVGKTAEDFDQAGRAADDERVSRGDRFGGGGGYRDRDRDRDRR